MKRYCFLTLLICSGVIPSISQNNLIGTDYWAVNDLGNLEPLEKETFQYDQSGNSVLESQFYWSESFLENDIPNAYDIYSEERKVYNSDNLITSFVYQRPGDPSGYKREEIYTYNNDCIAIKNEKRYFHDEPFSENITYYNEVTCQIDSIEKFEEYRGVLKQYYVERYFYDGNDELRVLYNQDSLGSFTNELFYYETTRNNMGLVTRSYFSFTDIGPALYLSEYDQFGNITYYAAYSPDNSIPDSFSFKLCNESFNDHAYNSTDQLIETSSTSIYYDFDGNGLTQTYTSKTVYNYYCDGYLNKRTYTSGSGHSAVKFYQYQNGHDCELTQEEDLLTIRPNFTQGQILIESEILQASESYISLYDMSGRRLIHLKTNRIQHYYLNLSDLPAGSYVLHVFNGEHSETERVVKM